MCVFQQTKSDKKDKLSHQSLNISSSSNAIVKILSHNHTFRHAGSYKYRIALAFVKPRGEEGQNGRLKCPMGFLVRHRIIFCHWFVAKTSKHREHLLVVFILTLEATVLKVIRILLYQPVDNDNL